jgi:hypothetical protein
MSAFAPLHVSRTGTFALPLPVADAFPLFSAEGERRWVPGWDPEYLHPTEPSNEAGTVFRTRHGGDETVWLVLTYDPVAATAEYARFTPGSRAGTVQVRCAPLGERSTRVEVSYALTALTPSGNALLEALTPAAYAAMLEEWRSRIHLALGLGSTDGVI